MTNPEISLPTIDIKHGKLLDPFFTTYSKSRYPDWEPPTSEQIIEKVSVFKNAWQKEGDSILKNICGVTGLTFVRDIFDVYIVSGTSRDMSDPIIIRSRYEADEFVDTLTHELLHRFLVLNNIKIGFPEVQKESQTTKNHVHVHALHTYIYLDVLNAPERLERDKQKSHNETETSKDYARSWEIVEEIGYQKIIESIKKTPPQQ